jgi:uncharacterized protein (UPF0264 family)
MMRLLVSAASAADAAAALEGGADFIDAKEPSAGALGAVAPATFAAIVAAVGNARPVTAALGDGISTTSVEADARMFATLGAALVKLAISGAETMADAHALAASAVRGARMGRADASVVLVAFADRPHGLVSPMALLDVASAAGAAGVLLDTADKRGPRLTQLATLAWLTEWTGQAHRRSLSAALAGRLQPEDLPIARRSGADVAGVRGAACEGGRNGRVVAEAVRGLRFACRAADDLLTHA